MGDGSGDASGGDEGSTLGSGSSTSGEPATATGGASGASSSTGTPDPLDVPPEFDEGEDDCVGPDNRNPAGSCVALAGVTLSNAVVEYEGGDGVWNAGESVVVTLNYAAGAHDLDAPALVAQVDVASRDFVSTTWIWWDVFSLLAESETPYSVSFQADAETPAGTEVTLRIGAASSHGSLTQCDCPEFEIDGWTQLLTVE